MNREGAATEGEGRAVREVAAVGGETRADVSPSSAADAATPDSATEVPLRAGSGSGLDRILLRGLGWTSAINWTTQIVAWAVTIVVARLLLPEHYGLVAMASVYLGLAKLLSEFGLGDAVFVLGELSDEQIAQLNGLAVLSGLAVFAVSCAAAPLIAWFFDAPRLRLLVIVMSTAFVIGAFRIVPYGLLLRDLQFRAVAVIDGAQALASAFTTFGLALAGAGYWALVGGPLAGACVSTIANVAVRPHGFARPRPSSIRRALQFSGNIIGGRLAWYFYSRADAVVVGRILGDSALGFLTLAQSVSSLAREKVTALASRVTPAVFARVQRDPVELRRYLLSVTEGLAVITIPIAAGVGLVAGDFTRVVLGDHWLPIVRPIQLLSVLGLVLSISPLLAQVLNVVGEERFTMRNGVASLVVVIAALLVGTRGGLMGVVWAMVISETVMKVPLLLRLNAVIGLRWSAYARALWPSASAALAMAVAVTAWDRLIGPETPTLASLLVKIGVGAVAYTATIVLGHGARLRTYAATLRLLRSTPAPEAG